MNTPPDLLEKADIERIHDDSLRILETVGVRAPNDDVLLALEEAGAKVDRSSSIVRFPAALVEKAVRRQVENNAEFYEEERNAKPADVKMWMSMGNLPQYVNLAKHSRRSCSLRDMLDAIIVGNSLSHVERVSCFTIPAPDLSAHISSCSIAAGL